MLRTRRIIDDDLKHVESQTETGDERETTSRSVKHDRMTELVTSIHPKSVCFKVSSISGRVVFVAEMVAFSIVLNRSKSGHLWKTWIVGEWMWNILQSDLNNICLWDFSITSIVGQSTKAPPKICIIQSLISPPDTSVWNGMLCPMMTIDEQKIFDCWKGWYGALVGQQHHPLSSLFI